MVNVSSAEAAATTDYPPELLSPAGDWECLRAAVSNGADAVYFGLPKFNARMRAENFSEEDLPRVMDFLHRHGVKGYVTLNVLIFPNELPEAIEQLQLLFENRVDAVIVQDPGLAYAGNRLFPGLRIHGSTQMTITSPEGVRFAESLGIQQVVLGREVSLRELQKFSTGTPLEVFVHGALCVAYSGQCLTSESLGQRSANRGECAQACRMPYEMVVDGTRIDLGDRRYLLSPQDLAAVREVPALIEAGIRSFKIEGRLKAPEYVAAVTAVYRQAIDTCLENQASTYEPTAEEWYRLEMTFSRGLSSGWMHGVDHQELVPARFGKKRGPLAGHVRKTGADWAEINPLLDLRPGDGVVFDIGGDTNHEEGGRILAVKGNRLFFRRDKICFQKIRPGDRVWKTDDPQLTKALQKSWAGNLPIKKGRKNALHLLVEGSEGAPLRVTGQSGAKKVVLQSRLPLVAARTTPLNQKRLEESFGKLRETPFHLAGLENQLEDNLLVPVAELNRLRRSLVEKLQTKAPKAPSGLLPEDLFREAMTPEPLPSGNISLSLLCRTEEQLEACAEEKVDRVLLDLEDIRRYRPVVAHFRTISSLPVYLATPRILKAGEAPFFSLIEKAEPDGVLLRNIGAIEYFRNSSLRLAGDFSLNVANPLTAFLFLQRGLETLTVSYDLDIGQVVDLVRGVPSGRLELTLHQHMPMFHMEHCAFAAFLSKGHDYTDCGRPCEKHRVHLRDHLGTEHPLRADVGCRNTLFNAVAQTGAAYFETLREVGLKNFRIELLEESASEAREIIQAYRRLIDGTLSGNALWKQLRLRNQLGVTKGTLKTK